MSDRMLFIGWEMPVRGREERAIEVFDECVGLYGRFQQQGRIDHFDIVLLEPSTGLGGWFGLHGTQDQLNAIRQDMDFRRMMADAELIVEGLKVCAGATGPGIAEEMGIYRDATSKVMQTH